LSARGLTLVKCDGFSWPPEQQWPKRRHHDPKRGPGYGYVATKAERDGVAELELRLAPGTGVGYQWFEGPTLNLSKEAGLVWVYENYKRAGWSEFFVPRLAYSVDWTPFQPLKLYHTLEYISSFEDLGGDYLLNIDAGARLAVWKGLFAELRHEFRYDARPPAATGRTSATSWARAGASEVLATRQR
jgi:hypothetical protein